MASYLESQLSRVLNNRPEDPAKDLVTFLVTAGLVNPAQVDLAERDAKIYELRATMTTRALAERFGITERQVIRVVKRQMKLHRAS